MARMRVALAVILLTILLVFTAGSFLSPMNMRMFNFPTFSTTSQSIFGSHGSSGLQLNMRPFSLSSSFQTIIPAASNSNGALSSSTLLEKLNGGQKNGFLNNLIWSGLQTLPTVDQSNSQYITTPTPTATPSPTPTPRETSEPLPPAGPNTYYESDKGKTVTINNGDILHVRLDEALVLAEWHMNTTDGLQIIGNTFYLAPKSYGADGRPLVNDDAGTRVFDIKATRPGVQKINAICKSVGSSDIYQDYELTVNVV